MHMADALLSPSVGGVMWAAAIGLEAYSINKLNREDIFENRKIPVMGVAGAFVFAAQMINFTIPATGSSGHLGGGLLLAALLGPYAGFVSLSVVLVIQALFFADGGLLALGANIFNMGFFTCFVAYPIIMKPILVKSRSRKSITAAAVLGAVFGLISGAFTVVIETTASGVTELPFVAFASLMLSIHLIIGVVEGIVTAFVLIFINSAEPALLEGGIPERKTIRKAVIALAVSTVLLAGIVSWFASPNPDGLEWSIAKVSASEPESDAALHTSLSEAQEKTSIFPDYDFKNASATEGVVNPGGSMAGLFGSTMTLVACAAACIVNSRRKARN